jgi:hypothetical protein
MKQNVHPRTDEFVIRPRSWSARLAERLTEPLHLNILSAFVKVFGSYTMKIDFDLIRPRHYAFAILEAARFAQQQEVSALTIIEFGVATGQGLLAMCDIARQVSRETGIQFSVIGFDTGCGMPPPVDYRDHPDLYQAGDFPMNQEELVHKLPTNARLILGDIKHTVPNFLAEVAPAQPIGFAAIDVDYYSSAVEALKIFSGPDPTKYLPQTLLYLDDIVLPSHSRFTGELLAVDEFNQAHRMRKIDKYRFLRYQRIFKQPRWISQIFLLHVLDHPIMNRATGRQPKIYADHASQSRSKRYLNLSLDQLLGERWRTRKNHASRPGRFTDRRARQDVSFG